MTNLRPHSLPTVTDLSRVGDGDAFDELLVRRGSPLVAYRDGDLVAKEEGERARRKPQPPKRLTAPPPNRGPDVRCMSPRQMQEYSQDLYAAGIISFDDYEALAFQPDLHPDFGRTIGALTGERAAPDRPRDFIRHWTERLRYTQRYYPANANEVRQAHRILEALKAFPLQNDIFAYS